MSDNIILAVTDHDSRTKAVTITPDIARRIMVEADIEIPSLDGEWVYSMRRNTWEPVAGPFLGAAHQADLEKAHAFSESLPEVTVNPSKLSKDTDLEKAQADVAQEMVDAVDAHAKANKETFVCLGINTAKALLAAIRAGKVPGVCMSWHTDAAIKLANEQTEEIAALRARVAELEADKSQVLSCVSAEHGHNEMLMARVAELEKDCSSIQTVSDSFERRWCGACEERDRALARVVELEKELATAVDGRAVHLKSHNGAVAERDRALADLGNVRAELNVARECHARTETTLKADLAAERIARDKLERELEGCKHPDIAVGMAYCAADDARQAEIDRLKADLAAEQERSAELSSKLDGIIVVNGQALACSKHVADAFAAGLERDAKLCARIDEQCKRITFLEGATNHAGGTPLAKAEAACEKYHRALRDVAAALGVTSAADWAESAVSQAKLVYDWGHELERSLAAERERSASTCRKIITVIGSNGPENVEDALGRFIAKFDEERERREKAEAEVKQARVTSSFHKGNHIAAESAITEIAAQRDAARAEVERLKAAYRDVADAVAPETHGLSDVIERIRSLRAEVAALKARKVKLPEISYRAMPLVGVVPSDNGCWYRCDDVKNAIRAAGVSCE